MTRVLVIGGVTFDSVVYFDQFPPLEPGTIFSKNFRETVGGTGAGKALNLNRLDLDVTLHALIGDDMQGRAIRHLFEREGLNFVTEVDLAGTERHINLMNTDGDRISIYARYATFEPEIDLARLEKLIAASDAVALNIINYCRRAIPILRQYNKPIWCDVHDYDGKSDYHQDFVNAADFLFFSGENMPDHRAFMQQMLAAGKKLVVCTRGKDGSTALTADGQWIETPALHYPVTDTNGAGDAFFAGVLYGYLQGHPVMRCLRFGTIAGGLAVASPELFSSDLSVEKLEKEYQRHYGDS